MENWEMVMEKSWISHGKYLCKVYRYLSFSESSFDRIVGVEYVWVKWSYVGKQEVTQVGRDEALLSFFLQIDMLQWYPPLSDPIFDRTESRG